MRVSARLLIVEIMALVGFAFLAGCGYLAWRLSQGPIDLEFIRPQVQRSLSEARGGDKVTIGSLALEWSRRSGKVEVAARDVKAFGKAQTALFVSDRAAVSLDATSLLAGKVKTKRIRLENGTASVVRGADGVWSSAGVQFFKEPPPAKDIFEVIRNLEWKSMAAPLRGLISAGSFELVEIDNFRIDVDDRKAGSTWSAAPVSGKWTAGKAGVDLSLDLHLVSEGDPNRLKLAVKSDGDVSNVSAKLALEGVEPDSLRKVLNYPAESFSGSRPASASLEIDVSEKAGLEAARIGLAGLAGTGRIAGVDYVLKDLTLDGVYSPATEDLELALIRIDSSRVAGDFSGSLNLKSLIAGAGDGAFPFTLEGLAKSVDVRPMFEAAWLNAEVDVAGSFALGDAPRIDFTAMRATIREKADAFTATGKGSVWMAAAKAEDVQPLGRATPVNLKNSALPQADLLAPGAKGEIAVPVMTDGGPPPGSPQRRAGFQFHVTGEGRASPAQVLAFWPVKLGPTGRDWVKEHILGGVVTKGDFTIDLPPEVRETTGVNETNLGLDFEVSDASVMYLEDFPPVTGVAGVGRLTGNSLQMDLRQGQVKQWKLDKGSVSLPRFHPKGALLEVKASGAGDLRDAMRVLEASNLKLGSKYGLPVEAMSGTGTVALTVTRPMADDVPPDALKYVIASEFKNAAAPDLAAGFGLTSTAGRINITETGLRLSGDGLYGNIPATFEWKETFNVAQGSELTAKAQVNPDFLNSLGFAARSFMQGTALVDLKAVGAGRDFSSISANVDFTKSALTVSDLNWSKKAGVPARGALHFGRENGASTLTGDIRADGLELIGDANMDAGGAILSAGIERIFSRGNIDLHGSILRKPDGGYRVALAGPLFDARPWMDSFLGMDSKTKSADPVHEAAAAKPQVNDIFLKADKVRLRDNAELMAVDVSLRLGADGPIDGHVKGVITGAKKLDVAIKPAKAGRTITVKSDDAGFASRVLLKSDMLSGGTMQMTGVFGKSVSNADLTLKDVRLRNAPLLAQLLSLASLRGLTDVLSGDGVLFTQIETPLKFQGDRIGIDGLRASGPAMGLTAHGWVAPKAGELSIDGVLVPSFGINSALGGLPLIGDLFVSRRGEGIFAPTYAVRGTFAKARVSVNPVAAMTPGVLRRIFEAPNDPLPDVAASPAPQASAGPAPKAPATAQPKR
jgi:hypothetical protein